jgi:hypothetical protein
MHVNVRIDEGAVRDWHVRLLHRLSSRPGVTASVTFAKSPGRLPASARLLFDFESLLHRIPSVGPSRVSGPKSLLAYAQTGDAHADLTIDLCGDIAPGPGIWHVTFDGADGESSLLSALIAGRAPVATIRGAGDTVAVARLGTETPGIARASFDDALRGTIILILAALDGTGSKILPSAEIGPQPLPAPLPPSLGRLTRHAGDVLARAIRRRLYHLSYRTPHWRTGWRRLDGPDLWDLRRHPASGWTDLPDDGLRFYADPFPIQHKGRLTLFVEEFDHLQRKGLISALAFDDQGPIGRPEPVLELPYHLSYPFVFADGDDIWMVPESCAAGTIDLYRATRFPSGWRHEARLVEGVTASDATLLKHDGRWWMFATVRDDGGTYSDTLHIWSAPDFKGPWTPHPRNPVLIDIASARPAGRFVHRHGALMRPVQDCRTGYGDALGLARVLRLDDNGFEQIVETTLHAGPLWPGCRLHTLNEAGGFEFIDGSGHARRRIRAPRALDS